MLKIKTLLVSIILLFAFSNVAVATPLSVMETTINKLVEIVEKFPGEDNLSTRREELRKVIEPCFDFREMARRSLGSHWNKVNQSQQNDFVDAFSELLARTYLSKIENVRSKMISMEGQKVKGIKAYVKTMVDYKGDSFPIDYKLVNKAGQWKVYDVVIENIGLVTNYRNEFSGIIRKDDFSGLLKRLQEKAAKKQST